MNSPPIRILLVLSFLLVVCVVRSYPYSPISENPSDATAIKVLLAPFGWSTEGAFPKNMMRAGLFEYAAILGKSAGNIFTYSWLEQNKITVVSVGIFVLVLFIVVLKW